MELALKLTSRVHKEEPTNSSNKILLLWLSYNLYVSPKSPKHTEDLMKRAAKFICQESIIEDYSPFKVMALLKFYKDKQGNYDAEILFWCNKIENPYQLSKEVYTIIKVMYLQTSTYTYLKRM